METPAQPVAAPGMVPLPLGDVLRIANEYERAGRMQEIAETPCSINRVRLAD